MACRAYTTPRRSCCYARLSRDYATPRHGRRYLPVLPLGDSTKIKIGETVVAIGNALGEYSNTVSKGVVSFINKNKVKWFLEQREIHRNVSKNMKISFNQLLENIRAVKNLKPMNAGILFFGKDPLKFISSAQLRAVRIKGGEILWPNGAN